MLVPLLAFACALLLAPFGQAILDLPKTPDLVIKYVESCPSIRYFFKPDLSSSSTPGTCYHCFCHVKRQAICWKRKDLLCEYHLLRMKQTLSPSDVPTAVLENKEESFKKDTENELSSPNTVRTYNAYKKIIKNYLNSMQQQQRQKFERYYFKSRNENISKDIEYSPQLHKDNVKGPEFLEKVMPALDYRKVPPQTKYSYTLQNLSKEAGPLFMSAAPFGNETYKNPEQNPLTRRKRSDLTNKIIEKSKPKASKNLKLKNIPPKNVTTTRKTNKEQNINKSKQQLQSKSIKSKIVSTQKKNTTRSEMKSNSNKRNKMKKKLQRSRVTDKPQRKIQKATSKAKSKKKLNASKLPSKNLTITRKKTNKQNAPKPLKLFKSTKSRISALEKNVTLNKTMNKGKINITKRSKRSFQNKVTLFTPDTENYMTNKSLSISSKKKGDNDAKMKSVAYKKNFYKTVPVSRPSSKVEASKLSSDKLRWNRTVSFWKKSSNKNDQNSNLKPNMIKKNMNETESSQKRKTMTIVKLYSDKQKKRFRRHAIEVLGLRQKIKPDSNVTAHDLQKNSENDVLTTVSHEYVQDKESQNNIDKRGKYFDKIVKYGAATNISVRPVSSLDGGEDSKKLSQFLITSNSTANSTNYKLINKTRDTFNHEGRGSHESIVGNHNETIANKDVKISVNSSNNPDNETRAKKHVEIGDKTKSDTIIVYDNEERTNKDFKIIVNSDNKLMVDNKNETSADKDFKIRAHSSNITISKLENETRANKDVEIGVKVNNKTLTNPYNETRDNQYFKIIVKHENESMVENQNETRASKDVNISASPKNISTFNLDNDTRSGKDFKISFKASNETRTNSDIETRTQKDSKKSSHPSHEIINKYNKTRAKFDIKTSVNLSIVDYQNKNVKISANVNNGTIINPVHEIKDSKGIEINANPSIESINNLVNDIKAKKNVNISANTINKTISYFKNETRANQDADVSAYTENETIGKLIRLTTQINEIRNNFFTIINESHTYPLETLTDTQSKETSFKSEQVTVWDKGIVPVNSTQSSSFMYSDAPYTDIETNKYDLISIAPDKTTNVLNASVMPNNIMKITTDNSSTTIHFYTPERRPKMSRKVVNKRRFGLRKHQLTKLVKINTRREGNTNIDKYPKMVIHGVQSNTNNHINVTILNRNNTDKVSDLKRLFKKLIQRFREKNNLSNSFTAKHNNVIKYLRRWLKKLVGKDTSSRTDLQRKRIIETLCETFGPCHPEAFKNNNLLKKIDELNVEMREMLYNIKTLRELLFSVKWSKHDRNLEPNQNQSFENDVQKLQYILKGKYLKQKYQTKLTSLQAKQIEDIKASVQTFVKSTGKFSNTLNEIIHNIKPSQVTKINKNISSKQSIVRTPSASNVTTIEKYLKKLKDIIIKYGVAQNNFIARILNSLVSLSKNSMKSNTVNKYCKGEDYKLNNELENVQMHGKKVIDNIRKLKLFAQRLDTNSSNKNNDNVVRKKRDLGGGEMEYLLLLMEYLLKRNGQSYAPANDGIDLIIEGIKNSPAAKFNTRTLDTNTNFDPINITSHIGSTSNLNSRGIEPKINYDILNIEDDAQADSNYLSDVTNNKKESSEAVYKTNKEGEVDVSEHSPENNKKGEEGLLEKPSDQQIKLTDAISYTFDQDEIEQELNRELNEIENEKMELLNPVRLSIVTTERPYNSDADTETDRSPLADVKVTLEKVWDKMYNKKDDVKGTPNSKVYDEMKRIPINQDDSGDNDNSQTEMEIVTEKNNEALLDKDNVKKEEFMTERNELTPVEIIDGYMDEETSLSFTTPSYQIQTLKTITINNDHSNSKKRYFPNKGANSNNNDINTQSERPHKKFVAKEIHRNEIPKKKGSMLHFIKKTNAEKYKKGNTVTRDADDEKRDHEIKYEDILNKKEMHLLNSLDYVPDENIEIGDDLDREYLTDDRYKTFSPSVPLNNAEEFETET